MVARGEREAVGRTFGRSSGFRGHAGILRQAVSVTASAEGATATVTVTCGVLISPQRAAKVLEAWDRERRRRAAYMRDVYRAGGPERVMVPKGALPE